MTRTTHPALVERGAVGSAVAVALQAALFTVLVQGALTALALSAPPAAVFGGSLALFSGLELRVRALGRRLRAPAVALASAVAAATPEAKVRRLRGLPVVEGVSGGRWFALHFESVGLAPVRAGVTVDAELGPVAAWLAARLPEDPPTRAEQRLRIKRRFVEVAWPEGAPEALVGLSPDPAPVEAWLASPEVLPAVAGLLLGNTPASATLELFGATARWDSRLTARVDAACVQGVVAVLHGLFPEPVALSEGEDALSGGG